MGDRAVEQSNSSRSGVSSREAGGPPGRQERSDQVHVDPTGTDPVSDHVVYNGPKRSANSSSKDVELRKIPKISLAQYKSKISKNDPKNQKKSAGDKVEGKDKDPTPKEVSKPSSATASKPSSATANLLQKFGYSPPRKRRHNISPSPSPSPPSEEKRKRREDLVEEEDFEEEPQVVRKKPFQGNVDFMAKILHDQNSVRDVLNQQNLPSFSKTPASNAATPTRSIFSTPPQNRMTDNMSGGHFLPPAPMPQLLGDKTGTRAPGSDLYSLFYMDMAMRFTDLQARQAELIASQSKKTSEPVVEDEPAQEDEESDEDPTAIWSGGQSSNKKFAEVSEAGRKFWTSLIGTDDKGKKDLLFKRPKKRPTLLEQFTGGDSQQDFCEPKVNKEIPDGKGWAIKEEQDLSTQQKYAGATGAAICLVVDNARNMIEDLQLSAFDFNQGKFQDPDGEAERVCLMLASLLEDSIINNAIAALKFVSTVFTCCSLKRHSLALKQVTAPDAKKVLEDSPPDSLFLFGEKVKDSVQRIRDTSLIKKAFVDKPKFRGRFGKFAKGYRNQGFRLYDKFDKSKDSSAYRPPEMRFRGRGFKRNRFGSMEDKSKKDKDD